MCAPTASGFSTFALKHGVDGADTEGTVGVGDGAIVAGLPKEYKNCVH